ncbi:MAG: tagaturonate epimerase family protein [Victivallaceae bacterium]|nr:tagaturonate epimerase family protein [Victivallaceae bacterium]
MQIIANAAWAVVGRDENSVRKSLSGVTGNGWEIVSDSVHRYGDGAVIMVIKGVIGRRLLVVSRSNASMPGEFKGENIAIGGGGKAIACKLDHATATILRRCFPWCAPRSLRNERTTIGCGDRLGLATRGHLRAIRRFQVAPVLAQQSMRELSMTGRTFDGVVDDATFMVFEADYRSGYGADGDHLKNLRDIGTAVDAGMPMITLDLSEIMNASAGEWDATAIDAEFGKLPIERAERVLEEYADREFVLDDGCSIRLDGLTARRCEIMYGKALDFAAEVHEYLESRRGSEFDLEISIDETTFPTLPSHHLFIARELRIRKVGFTSIAPRFVGEFQKAVDYIGDLAEFDRQFHLHALIARLYGNYKVSVHSGSDKFAVYPTIGRETEGYLHLKTAGTSWLVAVGVIARHDPELYRDMHRCALDNFQAMLKLYHITADISRIPDVGSLPDDKLPCLMEMPEARQLLHIAYGPILTGSLRGRFFAAMAKFEKEYDEALENHFVHHVSLLGISERN